MPNAEDLSSVRSTHPPAGRTTRARFSRMLRATTRKSWATPTWYLLKHARFFRIMKLFFTLHSARHTLQEIGKGRGEGVDARVELGRWAHSTADEDQTPSARGAKARTLLVSALPDMRIGTPANRVYSAFATSWSASGKQ